MGMFDTLYHKDSRLACPNGHMLEDVQGCHADQRSTRQR